MSVPYDGPPPPPPKEADGAPLCEGPPPSTAAPLATGPPTPDTGPPAAVSPFDAFAPSPYGGPPAAAPQVYASYPQHAGPPPLQQGYPGSGGYAPLQQQQQQQQQQQFQPHLSYGAPQSQVSFQQQQPHLHGTYPPAGMPPPPGTPHLQAAGEPMQASLTSQQSLGSAVYNSHQQPPMVYTSSTGGYSGTGGSSIGGSSGTHGPHGLPLGAPPPLSNMPATEVKLEISAAGLRDRDLVSKSDPVAVVFEEVGNWAAPASLRDEQQWREIGRTESIKDELNPHFKIHVTVPYRFEELQNVRIGLWDIDSKNPALTNQDFLGDVRTTLGDVVAAGVWTGKLTYPRAADNTTMLGQKRKLGTVTVHVHEDSKSEKIAVHFQLSGVKLDKKDLFGKSDPYVIITQLKGRTDSRTVLHKSEVIRKTLNPTWRPIRVLIDAPKGGTKKDVRIEFHVIDKDERARDDEIGVVVATLDDIEGSRSLTLVNSKNRKRGKSRSAGTLVLKNCHSLVLPTMINYLQGGLKLHFTVAVDLTASNGDPRNPASLHYMDPVSRSNQYVKALSAVANIINVYTPSDKRSAAFGFGADIDNSGSVSHCFPLSLQADPHCVGLEGIFAAYGHALSSVSLSGPTNFTPLLEEAMQLSARREHTQQCQHYDVLLILTDGVVSDFVRTIDKIIEASYTSATSIIIIGVGNADFKKMEIIDGDDHVLTSSDGLRTVRRDIVQFVPVGAVLPRTLARAPSPRHSR
jgi:hypothetical protein